jgi:hypothetical protein
MSAAQVWQAKVNEDGTATLLGRVTARDGTGTSVTGEGKCLKQADLSSITAKVFDLHDGTTTYTATLTISSVVFDSLQVDAIWNLAADSNGYNFLADLPTTAFPTGGRTYRAEAKFTTTGGTVGWGRWNLQAESVLTS